MASRSERGWITLSASDREILRHLAERQGATVGELQAAMPGASYLSLCGRLYRLGKADLVRSGIGNARLAERVVVSRKGYVGRLQPLPT
jgi:hypothetical protein